MLAIAIRAGHDRNGNSRKGWIVVDRTGMQVDFVRDHGAGDSVLRKRHPRIVVTVSAIDVQPQEWSYQIGREKA